MSGCAGTHRHSNGGQTCLRSRSTAPHPIVSTLTGAATAAGSPPQLGFNDSWFDAASFVRAGAATVIGYGPHANNKHGVDEHVSVDDLLACAKTLALTAMRWCGAAASPRRRGDVTDQDTPK